jgi:hypothetical protein
MKGKKKRHRIKKPSQVQNNNNKQYTYQKLQVQVLQKGLLLELRVRHQIILLLQWVQDYQTLLVVQGLLRIILLLLVRVQHQTNLLLVRHRKLLVVQGRLQINLLQLVRARLRNLLVLVVRQKYSVPLDYQTLLVVQGLLQISLLLLVRERLRNHLMVLLRVALQTNLLLVQLRVVHQTNLQLSLVVVPQSHPSAQELRSLYYPDYNLRILILQKIY